MLPPLDVTTSALPASGDDEGQALEHERVELLERIERGLERPMLVLALAWAALVVVELTRGLSAGLEALLQAVWVIFVLEFLLRLTLAPRKLEYLRAHWLTAVALAVPALRVFRAFRAFRAMTLLRSVRVARGVRLLRVVAAANRGTRALGQTLRRRRVGYVVAATTLVVMVGAAGLLAFEGDAPDGAFRGFGEALWFTAMLITTIASERWPRTAEGRVLCFLLSLYAMGVLGYITAALASHFVGRDAQEADRSRGELSALHAELAALREEVRRLTGPPTTSTPTSEDHAP